MKLKYTSHCFFLLAVLALQVGIQTNCRGQDSAPAGFEKLFNGTSLDGWYAIETYDPRKFAAKSDEEKAKTIKAAKEATGKFWRVENGEIVNDGKGPFLTTEKEFRDFELLLEYKTVAKADSGVYLKATPQVQIWDFTEAGGKWKIGADKGSGGLWNNSAGTAGKDPSVLADKPFGEWNKFKIRQIGARTSIWLNGKRVVNNAVMENYWGRKMPLINKGPIQLQTHGGEIRWRNVFVRELESDEANKLLVADKNEGFTNVFDGTNLDGWAGKTDSYEVVDSAVRCKPGKGGTIYAKEKYTDFVARFEFKLPPGGNNGLAIRYPGNGDTAYVGMCELQVLDSEHKKYKNLDARQYHGSAYGMVAAHRGYLRPTGEWNYQQVTVKGSTIKVELNGSIILNCDLSKVEEYMSGKPHPGKTNKDGHFGFAGHGDPVEFRNVWIKSLSK